MVQTWDGLDRELEDLQTLQELGEAEADAATLTEVGQETGRLTQRLGELEFQLALSGEYDHSDAIVGIHASEGGTESQDWAEMLLRMYLRWAEKRGYKAEVLDITPAKRPGSRAPRCRWWGSTPTATCEGSRGGTAWCASRPTTPPSAGTPPSPWWR